MQDTTKKIAVIKIHFITSEFSASVFQFSVSHDPSEIILNWWVGVQEKFLIISVKYGCST